MWFTQRDVRRQLAAMGYLDVPDDILAAFTQGSKERQGVRHDKDNAYLVYLRLGSGFAPLPLSTHTHTHTHLTAAPSHSRDALSRHRPRALGIGGGGGGAAARAAHLARKAAAAGSQLAQ